jgi:epoxyqueuosine reductase
MTTRREFLKAAVMAGAVWPALPGLGQGGRGRMMRTPLDPSQVPSYSTKVIPIDRWASLKADFAKILGSDGITRHKLFQAYFKAIDFTLPAEMKDARSIIVMATFAKSAAVDFKVSGQARSVLVPFQYYQDDWTPEKLQAMLRADLVKEPGRKLADISKRVPLKYLAARSGLGVFGRNNLIYVDGMGSYCLLHAFATDAPLTGDPDAGLRLLGECRHCSLCDRACPTSCIGGSQFIIDAGRCLTLFNENAGSFPSFILPSMHSALMGCLKCQDICPENRRVPQTRTALEGVTEEETRTILKGQPTPALLQSVRQRLRLFPALLETDFGPVLKRNLGALIRA